VRLVNSNTYFNVLFKEVLHENKFFELFVRVVPGEGEIDWQEPRKFDCWLVRKIFIFCCPSSILTRQVGEWPENQILIPDWTYFYCPGTTLTHEWLENQILIPD